MSSMLVNNLYSREDLLASNGSHAVLGASAYPRWANCPGSVSLLHDIPKTTSSYAEEGTAAHMLCERCLVNGLEDPPGDHLGEQIHDHEITDEMVEAVQTYVDYCRSLPVQYSRVEHVVDFSHYVPGGFGTSDFTAIFGNTLVVVDFKYGMGVKVDAKNNGQLMLYALGVYLEENLLWDIQTIELVICQPRIGNMSFWSCTVNELKAFGEDTAERAKKVLQDVVELVPGETQCRFCEAQDRCPAIAQQMEEELKDTFDSVDDFNTLMTNAQIAKVLPMLDQYQRMITRYRDLAKEELTQGNSVGDWKLVMGRHGNRKWIDEKEITAFLDGAGFEPYKSSLRTPTQIIKEMGLRSGTDNHEEFCRSFTFQPQGSPVLANGDDPRESLQSYADDFQNEG